MSNDKDSAASAGRSLDFILMDFYDNLRWLKLSMSTCLLQAISRGIDACRISRKLVPE